MRTNTFKTITTDDNSCFHSPREIIMPLSMNTILGPHPDNEPDPDWSAVWSAVLEKITPSTAREKAADGNYPLHRAVTADVPFELVSALLVAFRPAAEIKDSSGKLPLHLAAVYAASVEVVSALLVAFPQAAEMKDDDGSLPLHLAAPA